MSRRAGRAAGRHAAFWGRGRRLGAAPAQARSGRGPAFGALQTCGPVAGPRRRGCPVTHTHTQVNLAAKRSTSWVDVECQKATGSYAGGARPLRRAVKLVAKAAVAGWLLRRFVLRGDLPGVDWVAKRLGTDSQTATR